MLGAIIGDLAASTYELDKEAFYRELISERATLSEYSLVVFAANETLDKDYKAENVTDRIIALVRSNTGHYDSVTISKPFKDVFLEHNDESDHYLEEGKVALMENIVASWWGDSADECRSVAWQLIDSGGVEKESGYSLMFLTKILFCLRNGFTKDETYAQLSDVFKSCFHNWQWQHEEGGPLNYLFRAWDAFYKGFDFGSCLHNAVKKTGDKRLNCALTGAIAEAMYGCRCYYRKQKFLNEHEGNCDYLHVPDKIKAQFGNYFQAIERQLNWQKIFMGKNDESYSHVGRIFYQPYKSKYEAHEVDSELRRRILKSFSPGWEDRFYFYLENGWVYCVRSGFIICRFRIVKAEEDMWKLVNIQQGDDKDVDMAIEAGLYSCRFHWPYLRDQFKYLNTYYGPEDEMPKQYEGSVKAKFWYGEKMFLNTNLNYS